MSRMGHTYLVTQLILNLSFFRILSLQAQIGADPQNTLFAKCVRYKDHSEVPIAVIVGAAVAAAVLLIAAVIIIIICCKRRRSNIDSRLSAPWTRPRQEVDTQMETAFHDNEYNSTPMSDRQPTAIRRPQSIFPDDTPPSTLYRGEGLLRRDTESIYANVPDPSKLCLSIYPDEPNFFIN